MLYSQKRTVSDRPNPPSGERSIRNNCPGGYADYKIGMCYFDTMKTSVQNPDGSQIIPLEALYGIQLGLDKIRRRSENCTWISVGHNFCNE